MSLQKKQQSVFKVKGTRCKDRRGSCTTDLENHCVRCVISDAGKHDPGSNTMMQQMKWCRVVMFAGLPWMSRRFQVGMADAANTSHGVIESAKGEEEPHLEEFLWHSSSRSPVLLREVEACRGDVATKEAVSKLGADAVGGNLRFP